MPSKTFLRHINVLNALLMASLVVFFFSLLLPLSGVKVKYILPAPKEAAKDKQEPHAQIQKPSMAEYAVIAEQNVFSPGRKIPSEKADDKPLPKPEFVLYGTLIAGDTSMAFIEDLKAPYTTAGRGKRQRTLRVGGMLSGYTLSQVYTDRVVLVRGEERMEVRVMDSHKKARGAESAPVAAQTPPVKTISPTTLQDKSKGSGRPPGVIVNKELSPQERAQFEEKMPLVKKAVRDMRQQLDPQVGKQKEK